MRRLKPAAAALALLACLALALMAGTAVFFARPPVLVVTDQSFGLLYGERRVFLRQAALSFSLFRRVKKVVLAENAASDVAALSVAAAHARPWAVLFPYRYAEAARRYREASDQPQVVLFGGRAQSPASGTGSGGAEKFFLAATDTETDFYRAGLFAALWAQAAGKIAGEGGVGTVGAGTDRAGTGSTEGSVLFVYDRPLRTEEKAAFLFGLREGGCLNTPLYASSSGSGSYKNLACVVLQSASADFLEKNPGIPLIIFSWLDPALVPSRVKVIFDDSSWALTAEVLKKLKSGEGEGGLFPSRVVFPGKEDKALTRRLTPLASRRLPDTGVAMTVKASP